MVDYAELLCVGMRLESERMTSVSGTLICLVSRDFKGEICFLGGEDVTPLLSPFIFLNLS